MNPSSARLLLSSVTRITCPHCAHEFAVADGFARKALDTVQAASELELGALREQERLSAERQGQQLAMARDAAHAQALSQMQALTLQSLAPQIEALQARLNASEARLAQATAREAELLAGERRVYEQRLSEQNTRLAALQAEQLGLRHERQQLLDQKAALALEVQRQVDARSNERDSIVRRQEQERAALEKAELQKKIDDMAGKLAEAQARASQGSQQLQGEIFELAIEEGLRRAFPLDTIAEVKKGQRGGDVLQHVVTRSGQSAGSILWEVKRAKDWSQQWLPKLREDVRASGAAVGILVTLPGVVPRDWPSEALFAPCEDVWVTQTITAFGLAEALRCALLDQHRQRAVSAGKGEKMEAVYDYLTSPQFAQKLRAVYETFRKLREELESERNVTLQRWARRERQLQSGVAQLLGIGGEIQGLAQQDVPLLELEGSSEGNAGGQVNV
jgi:hypothetical protein